MMKSLFKTALVLAAVMMGVTNLTSCGDDDKSPSSNGNCSATLGGQNFTLTHGYWYINDVSTASEGMNIMTLEFYNFDYAKMFMEEDASLFPSSMNFIAIQYEIPESQTAITSTTIDSGDYHIYVADGVTPNNTGWQGETWDGNDEDSPLVIKKDGNKITIDIERAGIFQDSQSSKKNFTFSFSGALEYMPEELQDN